MGRRITRRSSSLCLLLLVILAVFPGCFQEKNGSSSTAEPSSCSSALEEEAAPAPQAPPALEPAQAQRKARELLAKMDLRQKVGQLFIFSFDGTALAADTESFIREYKAGNVILYGKNIAGSGQTVQLTAALRKYILEETGIPPYIGIDQEGGRVSHFYPGTTVFPGAMAAAAAAAGTPELLSDEDTGIPAMYRAMGRELAASGINLNFAPVCDVNSNPGNPVIGTRSFGDSPEGVAALSAAMIRGLQSDGLVTACAKHFPGHGDTQVDSHYAMPRIDKPESALRELELIPFQSAVDSGVGAVMSAHILFGALEPDGLPATLSPRILAGLLRDEMRFDGLVLTDSMRMDAIDKQYGMGDGCVRAVNAGADMLVLGDGSNWGGLDVTFQRGAAAQVYEAVQSGAIPQETLDGRVLRILTRKLRHIPSWDGEDPAAGITAQQREANQRLALDISRAGITLVRDTNGLLPLRGKKTLVISPRVTWKPDMGNALLPVDATFSELLCGRLRELDGQQPLYSAVTLSGHPGAAEISALRGNVSDYERVVLAFPSLTPYPEWKTLIETVLQANPDTVLVCLGLPYDAAQFPQASTIVCAYEYTPLSSLALCDALSSSAPAAGALPVKIEAEYP